VRHGKEESQEKEKEEIVSLLLEKGRGDFGRHALVASGEGKTVTRAARS
jgi:hypothetical protein